MFIRLLIIILSGMPFFAHSQSTENWKLYLNKKRIACSQKDSVSTVQVHKKDTTALRFVFGAGDTAFVRKLIVMNEQRVGIGSKQIAANTNEAVFAIPELFAQSEGNNLTFYIVKIPADPSKAALVRVAPQPVCHLQWIE